MSTSFIRWQAGLYGFLICALYLISFFLPTHWDGRDTPGYAMFLWGLVGMMIVPFYAFPWLANVFLWIGWICLLAGNFRGARKLGIWATILAGCYVPVCLLMMGWSDGGGNLLLRVGFGYIFWFLTMSALAVAGYALEMIASKKYQYTQFLSPLPPARSSYDSPHSALR